MSVINDDSIYELKYKNGESTIIYGWAVRCWPEEKSTGFFNLIRQDENGKTIDHVIINLEEVLHIALTGE